ncbi:hypothetical protein [Compostimonas suwonensis]|uniref:Uncharacterized protein n=1 Tax=Compostimonas suwonensis TaxID=1048394 RepID=A0A2M9BWV8_9MICO|nr:hypothetical protein [Compostimonas suwonensis]PJJ62428.1 hypothetical protein CLV54_2232 [Compostimonas suwonensis]
MAALDSADPRVRMVRSPRASVIWSLAAAGLLLGSAALQLVASLERWVVLGGSWTRDDISVEDHLFDYSYPADPWENLATTAQFFGAGVLLLAPGILAMARAARRGGILERVLAVAVAASFGLTGAHALVSGLTGAPSPAQSLPVQGILSLIGFVGLIILAVYWLRTSPASSIACLFLLGATLPGYLVATFEIAPMIAGYQSYDTTPWTETIVAASTAAAGLAMIIAAGVTTRTPRTASRRAQRSGSQPMQEIRAPKSSPDPR